MRFVAVTVALAASLQAGCESGDGLPCPPQRIEVVYPFDEGDEAWRQGMYLVTDHGAYALDESELAARASSRGVDVYPTEWPEPDEVAIECADGRVLAARVFADRYRLGGGQDGRVCETVSVLITEQVSCDE